MDIEVRTSGQISQKDVAELAAEGIKTIVCHRHDGEVDARHRFETMARLAAEAGMDAVHMPLDMGDIRAEHVRDYIDILKRARHPIHAYCGSGQRAKIILEKAKLQGAA